MQTRVSLSEDEQQRLLQCRHVHHCWDAAGAPRGVKDNSREGAGVFQSGFELDPALAASLLCAHAGRAACRCSGHPRCGTCCLFQRADVISGRSLMPVRSNRHFSCTLHVCQLDCHARGQRMLAQEGWCLHCNCFDVSLSAFSGVIGEADWGVSMLLPGNWIQTHLWAPDCLSMSLE